MKRIKILFFIMFLFIACQFNQSTHKDLTTGAYSKGDGLGFDDVQIEVNEKIENSNIVRS